MCKYIYIYIYVTYRCLHTECKQVNNQRGGKHRYINMCFAQLLPARTKQEKARRGPGQAGPSQGVHDIPQSRIHTSRVLQSRDSSAMEEAHTLGVQRVMSGRRQRIWARAQGLVGVQVSAVFTRVLNFYSTTSGVSAHSLQPRTPQCDLRYILTNLRDSMQNGFGHQGKGDRFIRVLSEGRAARSPKPQTPSPNPQTASPKQFPKPYLMPKP